MMTELHKNSRFGAVTLRATGLISCALIWPALFARAEEPVKRSPLESETERSLALLIGKNWWPF